MRIGSGNRADLGRQRLDALVEPASVANQILDHVQHARRQNDCAYRKDDRQLGAHEPNALAHFDAALLHEDADLVDDAGALADEALAPMVQGLQIQLIGRLHRHELHRRPLHGLRNRFGVVEVVLLALQVKLDANADILEVYRWHVCADIVRHPRVKYPRGDNDRLTWRKEVVRRWHQLSDCRQGLLTSDVVRRKGVRAETIRKHLDVGI